MLRPVLHGLVNSFMIEDGALFNDRLAFGDPSL